MSAVAQRDVIKAIVQAGLPTLTSQLSAHERHALLKFRLPNVPEPQNPQHERALERLALPLAWHLFRQEIDFGASVWRDVLGVRVPVMPLPELIAYKRRLGREVDRMDLAELSE